MNPDPMRRDAGLTLIELLVAISLLAVVAVMGWQGLASIAATRDKLDQSLARTTGLQATFAQLQVDSWQRVPPAQLGGRPTLWSDGSTLTLMRRAGSDGQPTRLQQVTYRVEQGTLLRETQWADAATGPVPGSKRRVILASDVDRLTVRIWANDGRGWRLPGPVPGNPPATLVPLGLELGIRLRGHAHPFARKFVVGAA